jgi:hypothetical protein
VAKANDAPHSDTSSPQQKPRTDNIVPLTNGQSFPLSLQRLLILADNTPETQLPVPTAFVVTNTGYRSTTIACECQHENRAGKKTAAPPKLPADWWRLN